MNYVGSSKQQIIPLVRLHNQRRSALKVIVRIYFNENCNRYEVPNTLIAVLDHHRVEQDQYLDEWLFSNSRYIKQTKACATN